MANNQELIETLCNINNEIAPAPWDVSALSAGIRHLQRNTEVMEESIGDAGTNLPDRYDGWAIAKLRNLLPEIIEALRSV